MIFHLHSIERADKAARRLQSLLAEWGVDPSLGWCRDTVAAMLGHADYQRLKATTRADGTAASPLDADVAPEVYSARKAYQAERLVERCLVAGYASMGTHILARIAEHVAVTGTASSGSPFVLRQQEIGDNGCVRLRIDMDSHHEPAVLPWRDIGAGSREEFAHLLVDEPSASSAIFAALPAGAGHAEIEMAIRGIEDIAPRSLYLDILRARLVRFSHGDVEAAHRILGAAFNRASYAWAPEASRRRRMKDRIRWWEEPATRPFMRLLREMFDVAVERREVAFARSIAFALLALEPSDILGIRAATLRQFGEAVDNVVEYDVASMLAAQDQAAKTAGAPTSSNPSVRGGQGRSAGLGPISASLIAALQTHAVYRTGDLQDPQAFIDFCNALADGLMGARSFEVEINRDMTFEDMQLRGQAVLASGKAELPTDPTLFTAHFKIALSHGGRTSLALVMFPHSSGAGIAVVPVMRVGTGHWQLLGGALVLRHGTHGLSGEVVLTPLDFVRPSARHGMKTSVEMVRAAALVSLAALCDGDASSFEEGVAKRSVPKHKPAGGPRKEQGRAGNL